MLISLADATDEVVRPTSESLITTNCFDVSFEESLQCSPIYPFSFFYLFLLFLILRSVLVSKLKMCFEKWNFFPEKRILRGFFSAALLRQCAVRIISAVFCELKYDLFIDK